ncbi:hypothetical protein BV22DRAFT_1026850 [Leucogyrophana mollusca]|uniref:Uncharacterized protein n=1 Tax=Leucogyrophana mollusca TaxID=85980 RepID=A0ACB8AWE9_9AGAM|nr:hypothetical protein BV22DRAFT_1026850 [Leucogyrophana mollusca]
MAPEIFERRAADGSKFRCSDSFLREWLHGTVKWSERRATKAAQKVPTDWEDKSEEAFLQIAYSIKEEDVPAELYVNTDQTQVVFSQGSNLTWAKTGAKQVSVIGAEEKRAITVVVSVANNGILLPFQAIYQGYSEKSCPTASAKNYEEVKGAGMRLEYSDTNTYWSTQQTMHHLVDHIIAPHFEAAKLQLGLPPSQKSIWQIDVWSVHRSDKFRSWMKANHPTIITNYVPGGCTGRFQPCDVGVQRPFKHSLKRSYHRDIVDEILGKIDRKDKVITVKKRIGPLRDRTVSWLWEAYQTLNNPALVKKVRDCDELGEYSLISN